jgi:hypothetical protein
MTNSPSRRLVLTRSAALVGAASSSLLLPELAQAQSYRSQCHFGQR